MAFIGAFDELRSRLEKLREIATGKFAAEARNIAGEAVFREAVEGWRSGTSPYGERWTGAKGRPLTLFKTGSLFKSMKLVKSPLGFSIRVDGQDFGRHTLATIQEYGGRIRSARTRAYAIRAERARRAAVRAGVMSWGQVSDYAKERTARAMSRTVAKPMTFKTADGKWHSKFQIQIHPNPMLPRGLREIPPRWAKAIEDELEALGSRRFGD